MAQMMMGTLRSLNGIYVEFPTKSIKVGDTWEMVIPKGPQTGPKDQALTCTLTKVDAGVATVTMAGKVSYNVKVGEGGDAPMGPMTVKGTSDIKGEIQIEIATGKTQSAKMSSKDKSTIDIDANGQQMSISNTSTSSATVKLQK